MHVQSLALLGEVRIWRGRELWVEDSAQIWRGCGVGRRFSSDLAWLWLWCRRAAAAPVQPLAWELPYASGTALKKQKQKKKKIFKLIFHMYGQVRRNLEKERAQKLACTDFGTA